MKQSQLEETVLGNKTDLHCSRRQHNLNKGFQVLNKPTAEYKLKQQLNTTNATAGYEQMQQLVTNKCKIWLRTNATAGYEQMQQLKCNC
ncbi:hypothetical protein F511_27217 [Dorcoceras hygrometricum]|uniref:Uncharacterized protein n=1 Tax=Dorcoceras hygrometricum TaxID=472368 RepID=A0A2Z7BP38_9LAMI|nr:hypothetical protein F511_27217 [Dorcoceras hygrometricum]